MGDSVEGGGDKGLFPQKRSEPSVTLRSRAATERSLCAALPGSQPPAAAAIESMEQPRCVACSLGTVREAFLPCPG